MRREVSAERTSQGCPDSGAGIRAGAQQGLGCEGGFLSPIQDASRDNVLALVQRKQSSEKRGSNGMARSLNELFLSSSNLQNEAKKRPSISTLIKRLGAHLPIMPGTENGANASVIREQIISEQTQGVRRCVSYQQCKDR